MSPLAYSLISPFFVLSSLLSSFSQGMGEYDEKEEEMGVDIRNKEGPRKIVSFIPLWLNRIQPVMLLTVRPRTS